MGTLWNLRPLAGMMLRYEVCLVLRDAGRPLTIADIVSRVRRDGFELPDRANKAVSDALRWDVRRQRVDRMRRGVYVAGRIPRSSEFRMRRRIAQARRQLALEPSAVTRSAVTPSAVPPSAVPPSTVTPATVTPDSSRALGLRPFRNSLERETGDDDPAAPAATPAATPAAAAAATEAAPREPEPFRNSLERGTAREWSPLAQDVGLLERAAERHFRSQADRRDGG